DHIRKGYIFGKISDFFYRVEYQQRGSPHIHMLLWLKHTKNVCQHVCAQKPPAECPADFDAWERQEFELLQELVEKHQLHEHKDYCVLQPAEDESIDVPRCDQNFPESPTDCCYISDRNRMVYT